MLFKFNGLGDSSGMLGGGPSRGETNSGSGSGGASSVMVSLDVGSVMLFDPKDDPHGISQRWKKGKQSLNCI